MFQRGEHPEGVYNHQRCDLASMPFFPCDCVVRRPHSAIMWPSLGENDMSALPYFRIARVEAKEILRRIEHALSKWREVGTALRMTNQELDQFADAFEHPERAAALKEIRRA